MLLTVQLKLVPTTDQRDKLIAAMEQYNSVCNYISEEAFKSRTFGKINLQKHVYYDARKKFGLSSQMTIRAIAKVSDSYKVDRRSAHTFSPRGSIQYDQRNLTYKNENYVSLLTLEKREKINYVHGDHIKIDHTKLSGQAKLLYRNKNFYLFTTIDVKESEPILSKNVIGVDLGIVNLATTSDVIVFSGDSCKKTREKYQKIRRKLQSVGTWNAKKHLKKLSKTERWFKRDMNHQISKSVVLHAKGTLSSIALEDLSGIRDRVTVRKEQREEHSKWAFAELRNFIQYKSQLHGVRVYIVDPRNTSKECSMCGYIDKNNRKTQSEFLCLKCGYTENADINAAKNIARRVVVNQPIALCA